MFMPKNDISIAEPVEVQIDEVGNNTIQMYQFIGTMNDEQVGGLEPILNYMNDNFFSKDDPAINEHHCNTTKKQYYEETHNIYNIYIYIYIYIYKTKTYNIQIKIYTYEHYYNKAHIVNNDITNNINTHYI